MLPLWAAATARAIWLNWQPCGQTVSVAAEAGSASAGSITGTAQASSISDAVATRISRRRIVRLFPGQDDIVMSATRPLAHHSHREPPDARNAQSSDS